MKTISVNVPVAISPQELAEARAEQARVEEERQRENLAKANRKAGKPAPTPGSSLFVATARGLKVRGRAGLVFSPTPAEVKVVDEDDAEIARRQKTGEFVVNEYGAEQILADSNGEHTGLILYSTKGDASAAPLADASDEALEAEIARRRAAKREGSPDRIGSTKRGQLDNATGDAARGAPARDTELMTPTPKKTDKG